MSANNLLPLLEDLAKSTTVVHADKGYDSMENRQHLKERQLRGGIMCKSHRNRPLTEAQTKRNRHLSKPVMWSNKALVRCTVNSSMPGSLFWSE